MLNTTKKKIAIIGSAPSSVRLAPYQDPEWYIFACSPGAYPYAGPWASAWFEAHRWEPQVPGLLGSGKSWFSPEYCEFLTRFGGTVWMSAPIPPEIPGAQPIPALELADKYGPYFFTSSIAFMMALALETPGVEEIGLWGVDMAAHVEYGYQRAGCQHFIQLAYDRGILVTVPPESDLLQPREMYGVVENHPMHIKLMARARELGARLAECEQIVQAKMMDAQFLRGAIDDVNYMVNTWITYQAYIHPTPGPTGNEKRSIYLRDKAGQTKYDDKMLITNFEDDLTT